MPSSSPLSTNSRTPLRFPLALPLRRGPARFRASPAAHAIFRLFLVDKVLDQAMQRVVAARDEQHVVGVDGRAAGVRGEGG